MKKTADASAASAMDLRFGQVGLLQVRLRQTDPVAILAELSGRIASAPQFFQHTGVCIDLSVLEAIPDELALRAVIDAVRRAGLITVGLSDHAAGLDALAADLGLPVLGGFRQLSRPPERVKAAAKAAAAAAEAAAMAGSAAETGPEPEQPAAPPPVAAQIHTQPVRSGQRVYARDRDLVLTATVGAGAEVMADGCVHVYGTLRGRAMAGVRGDATARLFCQEFRAELVAIAGVFRVFETLPAELAGQPVQAWLDGEDLKFARLGS
jgi:septum site-determining protein MinC